MANTQSMTTSFMGQLLTGTHNFGVAPIRAATTADTFKAALYLTSATVNAATTVYSSTGEVTGTGYTAGGNTLTISTSPTSGNNSLNIPTAFINFSNTSWTGATFTARAALIYNVTEGNKSVAVLDFGSDKTVSNDTFQIIFPTADANSAIVRIS